MADANLDSFKAEFAMDILEDAELYGFFGWFDVEMVPGKWFSKAPSEAPTHWHHGYFPLIEYFILAKGEILTRNISCKPHSKNYRGLSIQINFEILGQEQPQTLTYEWE